MRGRGRLREALRHQPRLLEWPGETVQAAGPADCLPAQTLNQIVFVQMYFQLLESIQQWMCQNYREHFERIVFNENIPKHDLNYFSYLTIYFPHFCI